MTRAIEVMNRKELERRARETRKEQMRDERRKAKEEEQDAQFAAAQRKEGGRSWKFW